MTGDAHAWPREIRHLRSFPEGRALKGERANTFSAGLEQAERLWNASAAVGPVASPVLMFYGLAQAGRALHRAGAPNHSDPLEGHGLRFELGSGGARQILSCVVKPSRAGLLQSVAFDVLASPVLNEPVTLTTLLASLGIASFGNLDQPTVLTIWNEHESSHISDIRPAKLIIGFAPKSWATSYRDGASEDASPAGVANWLFRYPSLSALGAPTTTMIYPHISTSIPAGHPFEKFYVQAEWAAPIHAYEDSRRWASRLLDIDQSTIGKPVTGIVIPTVGGNSEPQHPLVAWWIVLYAFSMLARYHAAEWMRLLDPDRSRHATAIEAFLDEARSVVPELLRRAIRLALGADQRATKGHVDLSRYGPAAPSTWRTN